MIIIWPYIININIDIILFSDDISVSINEPSSNLCTI